MMWQKIDRNNRVQKKGTYSDWKQQISNDCYNQCVYCSIHEQPWGGIDHYHIEHYKPKSKFQELENIITNLYHACPVCNRFKSDDWPNEPDDLTKVCYPDPSDVDYKDLFYPITNDYILKGKNVASKYLINRLYLNRPQLVYERRESTLKSYADSLIEQLIKLIEDCNDVALLREYSLLSSQINLHLSKRHQIVPYTLSDIRK